MNNLYQQLNPPTLNGNLKNFLNAFKTSSNPQQMVKNLISNNPQMQSVYTLIQNSNKNPKELFYKMAQEKGIDPESILQLLK